MVIFIILISPIHEHKIFLFSSDVLSLFCFSETGGIHWSGLSPILLNLYIFCLWCYDANVNRSVCIIPFSVCLVLLCRRAIDFCKLNLYSWLKLLIISKCFLLEFWGSLLYTIISPATIWLVPICIPLLPFSCHIDPAGASTIHMKKSENGGSPCFIPDLKVSG